MLKALELAGFKSFADKTRFEFPPGITVVVGPNGSGKSNIVDAIKWVLGEQSAKSLRGKDMADVIFKGSGEGSRRMLNAAEATIIFDNTEGRLPVDAPEVHVTRRVYRSGEGEYLINRQPCRLKDIKDLFRGTGVGTDAYSLIEQGKVDRMLQASPKDRRAMFEEAAGISRFKAKKIEAQRRLERVEQNLLRLRDIVDEVESRLRSVRAQASKARRYREYSDRLQQLRTHVGQADWRALSNRLQQAENALSDYRNQSGEIAAQAEACEARALELDHELAHAMETARLAENRLARTREQMVALQSAMQEGYARLADLDQTQRQVRQQVAAATGRAGELETRLDETTGQFERAQQQASSLRSEALRFADAVDEQAAALEALRSQREQQKATLVEAMRQVSQLSNRLSSLRSQRDAVEEARQRSQQRLDAAAQELAACLGELRQAESGESAQADDLESQQEEVQAAQQRLRALEQQLDQQRDGLADTRQKFSATRERVAVLEELERNQEGLTTGVREILERAQSAEDGPYAEVRGLVADLLQVDVDIAPLVDVALGDAAQYLAVEGDGLLEELEAGRLQPSSRVGLVRLDPTSPQRLAGPELRDHPGVIDRLDRLVAAQGNPSGLLAHLLGTTWVVESLKAGLTLHRMAPGEARFLAPDGSLVEPDGTVLVGPRTSASTIVSRRSELRACRQQAEVLSRAIDEGRAELTRLQETVAQQQQETAALEAAMRHTHEALAERRVRTHALRERAGQLEKQHETNQQEVQAAIQQQGALDQEWKLAADELKQRESAVGQCETTLAELEQKVAAADALREQHAQAATAVQVQLAKSEQQLAALQTQRQQFEADRHERRQAIQQARAQAVQIASRHSETQLEILRCSAQLAALYLERESLERQVARELAEREQFSRQKQELATRLQDLRRQAQKVDEQQHQLELTLGEIRHQRKTLAERLRDDYGIEVAALEQPSDDSSGQRDAVDEEIADLRRKISNIGAVNMEALNELDELEERFKSLASQYQDLTQAKEALERIIVRINADSRRLFQDTLEAIRTNFQALYRKAFGGGRADLVLEEGVDVLEAGIDIIATPPGKPSFNNSLLSGGEKALTAVSLLLAIFQYRPSPFCVLDEVDAPFDEANIGRFVDVLKGFLGWTKFVIVTHSKKTMTAATTLYGVTMQESGVSKRVSVRFEDVSEDGHISKDALQREQQDAEDAA